MCAFHSQVRKNGFISSSNARPVVLKDATSAKVNGVDPGSRYAVVPANGEQRLQRILELIESGQPCTIQALAEQFNLSHSRLQHLFKQQTGLSLGHLLTRQRMHRAAHLLTHSNKSVKEIAHAVGYEHASSFIRAFERHFAQAPRLFRQTQQDKAS